MKKIEVVLVDDHTIFREGVRNLLDKQTDMKVVGEAEDGRSAVDLISKHSPAIVVMDVTMPKLNGIETTRQILDIRKDIKVLALSMHAHQRLVREMLEAGARGYLLKECAFAELVSAIHLIVKKNQVYLCPVISKIVLKDYLHRASAKTISINRTLTPKEQEILQLIAEGHTNREIAKMLHMSIRTVEKHRLNVMRKLEVKSVAELVKYAIREGLTHP